MLQSMGLQKIGHDLVTEQSLKSWNGKTGNIQTEHFLSEDSFQVFQRAVI